MVYFTKSLRPVFDRIALASGLRKVGDPPCDAELARILVVAQLLDGHSDAVVVAAALRANALVSLSRRLAMLTRSLVPDLSALIEEEAKAEIPAKPPRPRRAASGDQGGRPRVCLVLDEWTHAQLVAYANRNPGAYSGDPVENEDGWTRRCAPDMALVRGLLEDAIRQSKRTTTIVSSYAKSVGVIEQALETAISAEHGAIGEALRKAAQ